MHTDKTNTTVAPRQSIRRLIGLVGLLLPIALIGGGYWQSQNFQTSLSMYYYTDLRDVFVGAMAALGVLFLCYQGYSRRKGDLFTDRFFAFWAGIGAIGIAFLPMPRGSYQALGGCSLDALKAPTLGLAKTCGHVGFAGLFIISLAMFSLILFRSRDGARAEMSPRKRRRNRTFGAAGLLTILSVAGIVGFFQGPVQYTSLVAQYNPVLWLEALAVSSIAWAWLAKSGAVFWLNDSTSVKATKKVSERKRKAAEAGQATMAAAAAELATPTPSADEGNDTVMEASEDGVVKLNRRQARRLAQQSTDARNPAEETQAA